MGIYILGGLIFVRNFLTKWTLVLLSMESYPFLLRLNLYSYFGLQIYLCGYFGSCGALVLVISCLISQRTVASVIFQIQDVSELKLVP